MSKELFDKKINSLIHSIGLNNNLRDDEVKLIVESQFRFTQETIKNLNLEGLTNKEIDDLKKVFYYKYLGKLFTSNDVMKRHENRKEFLKNKKNDQSEEYK